MNQGSLWTVVKPTVGLPLLLGAVAIIAILVHFALLTKTTWFGQVLERQGRCDRVLDQRRLIQLIELRSLSGFGFAPARACTPGLLFQRSLIGPGPDRSRRDKSHGRWHFLVEDAWPR